MHQFVDNRFSSSKMTEEYSEEYNTSANTPNDPYHILLAVDTQDAFDYNQPDNAKYKMNDITRMLEAEIIALQTDHAFSGSNYI